MWNNMHRTHLLTNIWVISCSHVVKRDLVAYPPIIRWIDIRAFILHKKKKKNQELIYEKINCIIVVNIKEHVVIVW